MTLLCFCTARPFAWHLTSVLLGVSLVALGWPDDAQAQKQMYRWIDEQGAVQYTDQPPPAQLGQGHTTLNQTGVRTETIPPPPTADELRQTQEQAQVKAQAAKQLAQQRAADQKLLQTYRSLDDLLLTGKGRLAAIDAPIQIKREALRLEQERLLTLHAEHRRLERAGKAIPAPLQGDIAQSEGRLRDAYAFIIAQELQKAPTRRQFADEAERYRALKKLPESNTTEPVEQAPQGLVSCQGAAQCGHYWKQAMAYFRTHAEATDEIAGPGLLLSFKKDDQADRRLMLVWIQSSASAPVQLYFDLECRDRKTAKPCASAADLAIRAGFHDAVTR